MDMGLPKGPERPDAARAIASEGRERFERHLSEVLRALGMSLSEGGTRGTRARLPR